MAVLELSPQGWHGTQQRCVPPCCPEVRLFPSVPLEKVLEALPPLPAGCDAGPGGARPWHRGHGYSCGVTGMKGTYPCCASLTGALWGGRHGQGAAVDLHSHSPATQ